MEAIVLAGGFGTRLAHVVAQVPKPMAPINGKPFLQYLLDDLAKKGVNHIIMAVGYKKECIIDYFGDTYNAMHIEYSAEDMPLFTGGAIKKAMELCKEENVIIVNGDTFFEVDIKAMVKQHQNSHADLTIAAKHMAEFCRYGTIETDESGRIIGFCEKQYCKEGNINGGIYIINRDLLGLNLPQKFSFETDFMEKHFKDKRFMAFVSEGYFIDIGIPQDYAKAQEDFVGI